MKIIVGISSIKDVKPVIRAGADELYCSLLANPETGLYSHRPNVLDFNLKDINELKAATQLCHKLKKKIFLAVNEIKFTPAQLKKVTPVLKKMDKFGLDGFIARDISFFLLLTKLAIKAERHLSSLAVCLNSECIKFYKNLGIKRIILPQHLTAKEYNKIKKINVKTEVFFHLINNCKNVDGICRYHDVDLFTVRGEFSFPCVNTPKVSYYKDKHWFKHQGLFVKKDETLDLVSSQLDNPPTLNFFAALFDFYKLDVDHLKLGTRVYSLKDKVKRVKFAKKLLEVLKTTKITKKEFIKEADRLSKQLRVYYQDENFVGQ